MQRYTTRHKSSNDMANNVLSIREAINVLTTPDYKKYMTQICMTLGKDMDTPFVDYVEQVNNDPVHWFNVFPDQLKSEAAFRKPYSALIKLLNDADVTKSLGEVFCNAAARKISSAWKANFKTILDTRCGHHGGIGSAYGADEEGSVNQYNVVHPADLEMEDSNGGDLSEEDEVDDGEDGDGDGDGDGDMDGNKAANDLCMQREEIALLKRLKMQVKELSTRLALVTDQARLLKDNNNELKEILVQYVKQVHSDSELSMTVIMKLIERL